MLIRKAFSCPGVWSWTLIFVRLTALRVLFLVTKIASEFPDPEHNTRLSGMMGWNLVKLAYKEFIIKYTECMLMFSLVHIPLNLTNRCAHMLAHM